MGALWSDDLYLLSVKELQGLPSWSIVTNIMGTSTRLSELDLDEMGARFGVSAWGIKPEEYEQYGEITVRRTAY